MRTFGWGLTLGLAALAYSCSETVDVVTPVGGQEQLVSEAAAQESDDCQVDADCGEDEVCAVFCGNGWCGGVCMPGDAPEPEGPECQQSSDCGPGEACQYFCGNGWCTALCAPLGDDGDIPPEECGVGAECPPGQVCAAACGNGWCTSTCQADCSYAASCDPGLTCVDGLCVAPEPVAGCNADADCPDTEVCVEVCDASGFCGGQCVPMQEPVLACIEECGIGCPAPEYWVCGASGARYCTECVAACYDDAVVICPPDANLVANAGPDQIEYSSRRVVLDGAASFSVSAGELSFSWAQISGPTVTIVEAQSAVAYFVAPAVTAATEVEIELTVTQGEAVAKDRVIVTVKPYNSGEACIEACGIGCPAPDYWVCSVSGNRYCSGCIAACYSDPVVPCPE